MFDFVLFRAINNLAERWFLLDILGILAAVYLIAAIAVLSALLAFFRRNIYIYLSAMIAAALGYTVSQWVGVVNFRPRPFVFLEGVKLLISKSPESKSFPSDHATLAFAIAASLIFSGEKKWGGIALAMAVFVALGRVYAGVHFPLDVLAGAVLGTLSAYVVNRIWKALKLKNSKI